MSPPPIISIGARRNTQLPRIQRKLDVRNWTLRTLNECRPDAHAESENQQQDAALQEHI